MRKALMLGVRNLFVCYYLFHTAHERFILTQSHQLELSVSTQYCSTTPILSSNRSPVPQTVKAQCHSQQCRQLHGKTVTDDDIFQ